MTSKSLLLLTSTNFNMPPSQSLDVLFNFDMSGLSGQRPISDAAPGDKDFNGGRWSVHFVVFTEAGKMAHDPDMDGVVNFEQTSAEMVHHHYQLGHLEVIPANLLSMTKRAHTMELRNSFTSDSANDTSSDRMNGVRLDMDKSIETWLNENGAPGYEEMPSPLVASVPIGCKQLQWQGRHLDLL